MPALLTGPTGPRQPPVVKHNTTPVVAPIVHGKRKSCTAQRPTGAASFLLLRLDVGRVHVLSCVFLLYQNFLLVDGSMSATHSLSSSSDSPSDSTTTVPWMTPKADGRSHTLSPEICVRSHMTVTPTRECSSLR